MKKIITALLMISGITLILVTISIKTFPGWLSIPGGILILLGIAFNAVLDVGSKIKSWIELLYPEKKKNTYRPSITTTRFEVEKPKGPFIFAKNIEHLELHEISSPDKAKQNHPNLADTQLDINEGLISEEIEHTSVNEYIPWILLMFEEGKHIEIGILEEWNGLLDDRTVDAKGYLEFLGKYAGFFFRKFGDPSIVISGLRLGTANVIDLVDTKDNASLGFSYEFIKIVSPHIAPYSKNGPSSELIQAISQVNLWKAWLRDNVDDAKWLLPSSHFKVKGIPLFKFTIYIGRRSNSKQWITNRNELSGEHNIQIRSFDALTESFENNHHYFPLGDWSSERNRLSMALRTELVNPFTQAFSDKAWREMLGDPHFDEYHMVANNAKIILSKRKLNKLYKEYVAIWKSLSEERKNIILDNLRAFGLDV